MRPRAGVVGTGYLGTFHAEKYSRTSLADLAGIYDADKARAEKVALMLNCRCFESLDELLENVDLASIVTPTVSHHADAKKALEKGVHLLVEKPITSTLGEADELIELAAKKKLCLQVGHLERFNPAFRKIRPLVHTPLFIQSTRIAPYSKRNIDVSVLLDLMIHDIDLALLLNETEVASVEAMGGQVFSDSFDIATVRLRFAGGCTADLTASRLSAKVERKLRVFQKEHCFSVDFNEQLVKMYAPGLDHEGQPTIKASEEQFSKADQIMLEIESFINSVIAGQPTEVSGEEGREALRIALMAIEDIKRKL